MSKDKKEVPSPQDLNKANIPEQTHESKKPRVVTHQELMRPKAPWET
jgi:hypothetical protein